jgi:hypothetical protein
VSNTTSVRLRVIEMTSAVARPVRASIDASSCTVATSSSRQSALTSTANESSPVAIRRRLRVTTRSPPDI